MFLRFWIVWAFVGLSIATVVFWWALHRGQFDDSRRAALLVLDDAGDGAEALAARPSRAARWNFLILMAVVAISVGLGMITAILALHG